VFHIAVCDDEIKDIKMICGYLQELWQEEFSVAIIPFTKGEDLLASCKLGEHFDVIILDIIKDTLHRIDIAHQIRQYDNKAVLIMLTATEKFAVEGHEVDAYRCISKPIDKGFFLTEISVLLTRLAIEQNVYYKFANDRGLNKVKLSNVYYFESNMRNIRICENGNEYIFTGRISDVENELAKQDFVRNHKSYVVNLKYVRNVYKDTIIMENNEKLPLSKHRGKKLRERFSNYMKAGKE
jgi:DNA-binding LytR/AlgR family response regulator